MKGGGGTLWFFRAASSEDQLLLKVQLFIIYRLYNHSCIISYVAFSVGDAKLISTSRGRSSLFFETAAILSVQHFLEILTITLVFSSLSKNKYTLNNDHNQPFSKVFSSLAWLLYVPLWQREGGGGWGCEWRVFLLICSSMKDYCTLVFQWQWHGVPKFAQQISHFSHITVKKNPSKTVW